MHMSQPQRSTASAVPDWPISAPEAAGYSSDKLKALQDVIESIHSPAGAVIVDGKMIYSWGDISQKMWIHSCRKSLLSALIGIAVDRGQLDLSKTLSDLNIDDIQPSLSAQEKRATVLNLLEARSGVYHLATEDTPSMKALRPARDSHLPGTFWYYNNWDFNTLGAIYEMQTGTSIFEAFLNEIALPIGMQDYGVADGHYAYDQTLSQFPAYNFKLSTRDFARVGQLYLQGGSWNGRQIISQSWTAQSVKSYSDAVPPAGKGYGYLWWLGDQPGSLFNGVDLGPGAFAAEGYGGHYLVVVPKYKMVVVSRADDAWFNQDVAARSIGANREGKLLAAVLASKISP